MTNLCLLGASGSIGEQTLDVINKHPLDFNLVSFSVNKQTRKIASILKHNKNVKAICIGDKKKIKYYQEKYKDIVFYSDDEGLISLINNHKVDMVVNALVGFVGLLPSITTLENNIDLALANKESLVVGGEIINNLLLEGHGHLYPIDSEHSALWKCLKVSDKDVDKLLITASGGSFRKLNRDQLNNVTVIDALNHPTWSMGKKITIDSATMVNKAFEIIEAYYLFNYPLSKIDVILHDESMVHSLIRYKDKTLRAEYSYPDMRNPIVFALYKGEIPFDTVKVNSLDEFKDLHFHDFDINRYPVISHTSEVINKKGGYGCVFNASNEVAVNAFLKGQIKFLDIERIIDECMSTYRRKKVIDYKTLQLIDKNTRKKARRIISSL